MWIVLPAGDRRRARRRRRALRRRMPRSRRARRGDPADGAGSAGFGVTLRQIGAAEGHRAVPEGEAPEAGALPRPSRPQPLRGRHGEVHRLRALRRRVPGASASTCAAPTTRPTRRCRRASATASSTRSTTCAASTATCASRRAPPRRSPRRSCSSSRSPTARTRSTRRPSCSSTTTAAPAASRGSCGSAARTTTPARGCARPRRAGRRVYEGRVGWSGELGFGVRAPEDGQSATEPDGELTRPPEEPVGDVDTEHGEPHAAALTDGRVHLLRVRGASRSPARSASCWRATRCTRRCCSS